MSVYITNLDIYTGTDFAQTFILEDSGTNYLMDLDGYTIKSQMKRHRSSINSIPFNTSFPANAKNGKLTISMDSSTTAILKPGKYLFDVLLISPEGNITRAVEGQVFVKKAVTR